MSAAISAQGRPALAPPCLTRAWGKNGTPREDGTPAEDGTPREDGTPGKDGTPREDGTTGKDGTPREDGTTGEDGTPRDGKMGGPLGKDGAAKSLSPRPESSKAWRDKGRLLQLPRPRRLLQLPRPGLQKSSKAWCKA